MRRDLLGNMFDQVGHALATFSSAPQRYELHVLQCIDLSVWQSNAQEAYCYVCRSVINTSAEFNPAINACTVPQRTSRDVSSRSIVSTYPRDWRANPRRPSFGSLSFITQKTNARFVHTQDSTTQMGEQEPEAGAIGTATLIVEEADLAAALAEEKNEAYAQVFATPRMIGTMEVAASRVLAPLLKPGQLSVGVNVNVFHTAATPLGAKVEATAKYLGRQGKLYEFEVTAKDPGGQIGNGKHTRAIITTERLMNGASKRGGQKL